MANDATHRKHRRSASDEEEEKSSKRHKHRHHRRHHHHRHRHGSNKNEEESCRDQDDSVPPVANRRSRLEDDVEEGEILEEDESGVRENESAMKEADVEYGEIEADGNSDRADRSIVVSLQPTLLYVSLTSCLLLYSYILFDCREILKKTRAINV